MGSGTWQDTTQLLWGVKLWSWYRMQRGQRWCPPDMHRCVLTRRDLHTHRHMHTTPMTLHRLTTVCTHMATRPPPGQATHCLSIHKATALPLVGLHARMCACGRTLACMQLVHHGPTWCYPECLGQVPVHLGGCRKGWAKRSSGSLGARRGHSGCSPGLSRRIQPTLAFGGAHARSSI